VPARHLVNGTSIAVSGEQERIEYFHIELAAHDVRPRPSSIAATASSSTTPPSSRSTIPAHRSPAGGSVRRCWSAARRSPACSAGWRYEPRAAASASRRMGRYWASWTGPIIASSAAGRGCSTTPMCRCGLRCWTMGACCHRCVPNVIAPISRRPAWVMAGTVSRCGSAGRSTLSLVTRSWCGVPRIALCWQDRPSRSSRCGRQQIPAVYQIRNQAASWLTNLLIGDGVGVTSQKAARPRPPMSPTKSGRPDVEECNGMIPVVQSNDSRRGRAHSVMAGLDPAISTPSTSQSTGRLVPAGPFDDRSRPNSAIARRIRRSWKRTFSAGPSFSASRS